MPSTSTMLTTLGSLLMVHAAYSTLHFRSILQDLGDVQEPIPPVDVYIEVVLSFAIILFGQLTGAGSLQSVEVSAPNRRPLVAPTYRTRKFDIYEHRGKVMKSL